jgi:hypothetical protein
VFEFKKALDGYSLARFDAGNGTGNCALPRHPVDRRDKQKQREARHERTDGIARPQCKPTQADDDAAVPLDEDGQREQQDSERQQNPACRH